MSWSIGLNLGDATLEMSATQGDELRDRRVFAPSNPLGGHVVSFLDEHGIQDIDRLTVYSNLTLKMFEKGFVSPCAILVTTGMESLLEVLTPISEREFTRSPSRPRLPYNKEFIFGVSERTNGLGQVEKPVADEDLEFLVAKLKMNEIKNVAVCFLHSSENPKNEVHVRNYLVKNGFQVFISSDHEGVPERARFWAAIYRASVLPIFQDKMKGLLEPLQARVKSDRIYLGNTLYSEFNDGLGRLVEVPFDVPNWLAEKYGSSGAILYCGLECWFLIPQNPKPAQIWDTVFGPLATPHRNVFGVPVHPMQELGRGNVCEIALLDQIAGWDTGPMCFGRSMTPTLFDAFVACGIDIKLTGAQGKIHDRGMVRLKESLRAYAKVLDREIFQEGTIVAEAMLDQAALRLGVFIDKNGSSKKLMVCGPMQEMALHLLRRQKSDLNFEPLGDEFYITREIGRKDIQE